MAERNARCIDFSHPRTHLMGILNVTPDSFSDGGQYMNLDHAVERAFQMIQEGATIIDIGGESTRPGANQVTQEEELSRVIPVISALREKTDIPISIDTYKAEVARQALLAGATMINDVWGGIMDPHIWQVAKDFQCTYILTHNRLHAGYQSVVCELLDDLRNSVSRILQVGLTREQLVIDPGIGYAKSVQENLQVMNHLEQIVALGYPVLLGTSRKKFIRTTLHLPADDVLEGTAVTVALGVYKGCKIFRVHDVSAMNRVITMTKAIRECESGV